MGIRDLEWEKLLAENSDGDILKQNISKHLLDLIKAAYDLGWHDCAQQSKGSADQQTNNRDYTADILNEFHKCRSEGIFRKPYFDLKEMAVRLNSAIKASQNCA